MKSTSLEQQEKSERRKKYDRARERIDSYLFVEREQEIRHVLNEGELNQLESLASYSKASAYRYAQLMHPLAFGSPPDPKVETLSEQELKILNLIK